jgi:hypothetical protein
VPDCAFPGGVRDPAQVRYGILETREKEYILSVFRARGSSRHILKSQQEIVFSLHLGVPKAHELFETTFVSCVDCHTGIV